MVMHWSEVAEHLPEFVAWTQSRAIRPLSVVSMGQWSDAMTAYIERVGERSKAAEQIRAFARERGLYAG